MAVEWSLEHSTGKIRAIDGADGGFSNFRAIHRAGRVFMAGTVPAK